MAPIESVYSTEQVFLKLDEWRTAEEARAKKTLGVPDAEEIIDTAIVYVADRAKKTETLKARPQHEWPEKFKPLEFSNDGELRNYFRLAVRYEAREQGIGEHFELDDDRDSTPRAAHGSDPVSAVVTRENISRIEGYLASLPACEKDAILSRASGATLESIAKSRAVNVSTVSRWVDKARRRWIDE